MWLSRQMRPAPPTADADLGMTTIGGESAGVLTRGEVRALPVYGPGGYAWLPENGAAVLVIKGGPGGEEQCVVGKQQNHLPEEMKAGEVFLYGPDGNSIYLREDGVVEIWGALMVNGEAYRPCTCGEEVD